MNFIDCLVGWPGSVHDARVLQNSEIGKDYLFGAEGYLLGDAAYPLKEWLMIPFKNFGQLTQEQKVYNEALSSTRCKIKRAFALLKGRFRKLKYMDVEILEDISLFIMASCILHNICLWREEDIHDMMEEGRNHVNYANDGDGLPGQLEEYGDAAAILYLVDVVQQ
ncbi:Protein ALP1-like [Holothuria leucospilota]|uniref:Protein ALP1-like n=1 Tax=Holothuria leucospilota TaxID=206669 RepID=A0A9Q1CLB9_HOLLE|nr:Protein ALP1-like [Holothuria leucospilota]